MERPPRRSCSTPQSPGEHTILYTVTDPKGLMGSASRTVIVSALKAANDNPQPQEQSSHDGNHATSSSPSSVAVHSM
jgi:hypothetical protein